FPKHTMHSHQMAAVVDLPDTGPFCEMPVQSIISETCFWYSEVVPLTIFEDFQYNRSLVPSGRPDRIRFCLIAVYSSGACYFHILLTTHVSPSFAVPLTTATGTFFNRSVRPIANSIVAYHHLSLTRVRSLPMCSENMF